MSLTILPLHTYKVAFSNTRGICQESHDPGSCKIFLCILPNSVDMARYMDILHVLNYWILGIFDFFVILPLELENMVRLLNF